MVYQLFLYFIFSADDYVLSDEEVNFSEEESVGGKKKGSESDEDFELDESEETPPSDEPSASDWEEEVRSTSGRA